LCGYSTEWHTLRGYTKFVVMRGKRKKGESIGDRDMRNRGEREGERERARTGEGERERERERESERERERVSP
jgi:hypothetical protein